jgi:DNA-binding NarL/FixJ family response regulator
MNSNRMKSKIKILIADDFLLLRTAWKILLTSNLDFEVIGTAEDGIEAIDFVTNNRTDVVLMDISMPNLNGVDATSALIKIDPAIKVIGLSMHNEFHYANKMISAGAKGFVTKSSAKDELFKAIYDVYNGIPYISPAPSNDFSERFDGSNNIASIDFI